MQETNIDCITFILSNLLVRTCEMSLFFNNHASYLKLRFRNVNLVMLKKWELLHLMVGRILHVRGRDHMPGPLASQQSLFSLPELFQHRELLFPRHQHT